MIALLGVWLAAIASPGPDLFQIVRVGAKDRRAGVLCARSASWRATPSGSSPRSPG